MHRCAELINNIIIRQTHYEKSDWSKAFNQFTIACELDMIKCKCKCKCNLFTHGAPRSSKKSFKRGRAFPDRIGIWKCWFLRRWENRSTRRKTSRSRVENQQQTQLTYDAGSGNRTRDTLVGGSALTTAHNPAADIAFIMSSSTSAWLLSPWSVLLRNKMAERFASVSEDELNVKNV